MRQSEYPVRIFEPWANMQIDRKPRKQTQKNLLAGQQNPLKNGHKRKPIPLFNLNLTFQF